MSTPSGRKVTKSEPLLHMPAAQGSDGGHAKGEAARKATQEEGEK
jgi:hypothetical protein